MREKVIKKEDLGKYFIGVDLAYRLKWWQKILVWLKIVRRGAFQDFTCSTVFKKRPDGTLEVVDINYL